MKRSIGYWILLMVLVSCTGNEVKVNRKSIYKSAKINLQNNFLIKPSVPDHLYDELIDFKYNKINSFGDKPGLIKFYKKLRKLQNGEDVKINIAHFGGSHVQAGQLTSAIRQQFDHFSPHSRGPRGFVFPSRLVKSNGPDYTKIEFSELWKSCKSSSNKDSCDWGMAGQIAITKSKINTIKTWAFDIDSVLYPFHSVRIYRKDIEEAFIINVINENCKIYSGERYIDVVFENLQDTLKLEILKKKQGNSSFELQGFLFGNKEEKGITYHDLGVNGAGIKSYLGCDLLEEQLADLQIDLVIIGLGLNDTYMPKDKFRPNELQHEYQQFIDLLLNLNPSISILLLTNNDHYYKQMSANHNSLFFSDMIDDLARVNSLSSWDLFRVMGGLNSIRKWEEQELAKPDLIHFTNKGYQLQANILFEAMMKDYKVFTKEE